ncbi:hypothetical protein CSA37_02950 [Candidatus Fermentibacteria bacterium]|nr:MAG: hypothetical protein CSA37_02950 [Candidatus Fermentibacteria bacterium]
MPPDISPMITISERRRTWLQVGRLSVLCILSLSGYFYLDNSDVAPVYLLIAGAAVFSGAVFWLIIKKNLRNRKGYWFLLLTDALLLGAIIYTSGGVDGPFIGFLLIHSLAYGLYLGVGGGIIASGAGILATALFSVLSLNTPGPDTTFSPLIHTLLQSGQMKLSANYIAMRIVMNGFLAVASGIGGGILGQALYTENGVLQKALDNMAELRARSRQVLESLHDGVVVVDNNGDVLAVNPAAVNLLGTDQPVTNSPLGHLVSEFLNKGQFPPEIDIILDDNIIQCKFSRYGDGGGAIVILTDITDLRNYRAALEERDKLSLIGKLSATMAHEIRNPLASMSGAAQMLASGTLSSKEISKMADLIDKQSKRVSELIEGYLSLSRSGSDFPMVKLSVNSLVKDNVDSAVHGFAGGVSINFLEASDDPLIKGNKTRLSQVIANLMRNSVEALCNTHAPLICVSVRTVTADNSVRIEISDNGPGIEEKDIKNIWEPFWTTRQEGTGLGLYVVKRIVSEHNGTVKAENGVLGGAVFTISLPGAVSR